MRSLLLKNYNGLPLDCHGSIIRRTRTDAACAQWVYISPGSCAVSRFTMAIRVRPVICSSRLPCSLKVDSSFAIAVRVTVDGTTVRIGFPGILADPDDRDRSRYLGDDSVVHPATRRDLERFSPTSHRSTALCKLRFPSPHHGGFLWPMRLPAIIGHCRRTVKGSESNRQAARTISSRWFH